MSSGCLSRLAVETVVVGQKGETDVSSERIRRLLLRDLPATNRVTACAEDPWLSRLHRFEITDDLDRWHPLPLEEECGPAVRVSRESRRGRT
ncbi:hypothetical protein LX15_002849 [Streptoalloteichus tenebrarius]|uniref:Transposase n=1 Tax=Streptoalloteichus tenebrarius (strain ATCC 17920 / DSM 40477 / JCM 4838 / CBS 697.72 / NBRC 16177 / NCIMB 11028 / NRRL B-12390 / A12253. 1 / ISP 5477) TaxID=1933 RepID=A0ABT1HUH8_STRSD|nr:hypothetical protein [Streptoalloteichus tenebrarius]MCP2259148.1 hypothetical protein [Streptoalloteichus tenebrarius]BFF04376.1 hypothetical protein GCM10020241_60510 [Streptoalloteichus tenebrarius]